MTETEVALTTESVEQRYRQLKAEWQRETAVLSNPHKKMAHPAIRAIIAMGMAVVPSILRDLADPADQSLIVWALPEITGDCLVPPIAEGGFLKWSVAEDVQAWLAWGRQKGLI